MSQSASHSLRLVSRSSLCCAAFFCLPFSSPRHCGISSLWSAVSFACLSLRLITAVSRLSALLFLAFSSPHQSLVSLFCYFFRLSQVSLGLAAVALGLTPLLLMGYYTSPSSTHSKNSLYSTLHEARSGLPQWYHFHIDSALADNKLPLTLQNMCFARIKSTSLCANTVLAMTVSAPGLKMAFHIGCVQSVHGQLRHAERVAPIASAHV